MFMALAIVLTALPAALLLYAEMRPDTCQFARSIRINVHHRARHCHVVGGFAMM
jgi:hypothetical protein